MPSPSVASLLNSPGLSPRTRAVLAAIFAVSEADGAAPPGASKSDPRIAYPKIRDDLTYHPEQREASTVVFVRDALRSYIVGLNEMQIAMMRLLNGNRTHEEIAGLLEEQFEVEIPVEKVTRFVAYLEQRMLLDVTSYSKSSEQTALAVDRFLRKRRLIPPPASLRSDAASGTREAADALVDRGTRCLDSGNPGDAAVCFTATLEVDPSNARGAALLDAVREAFFRAHRTVAAHMKMVHLWNPDRSLTHVDRAVGRWVYSRWGVLLLCAVVLSAIPAIVHAQPTPLSSITFADVLLFFVVLTPEYFVHEVLGHGLACKHYGGQVDDTGAMLFYGIIPGAYTNVIDVHRFGNRRHRVIVYLAGVAVQLPMLALWWQVYAHTEPTFFLRKAIYIWLMASIVMIGKNLVPTIEGMDAYYALEHYLDIPDLATQARAYAGRKLKARFFDMPDDVPLGQRERRIFGRFEMARLATSAAITLAMLLIVVPFVFRWNAIAGVALGLLYSYRAIVKPLAQSASGLANLTREREAARKPAMDAK